MTVPHDKLADLPEWIRNMSSLKDGERGAKIRVEYEGNTANIVLRPGESLKAVVCTSDGVMFERWSVPDETGTNMQFFSIAQPDDDLERMP